MLVAWLARSRLHLPVIDQRPVLELAQPHHLDHLDLEAPDLEVIVLEAPDLGEIDLEAPDLGVIDLGEIDLEAPNLGVIVPEAPDLGEIDLAQGTDLEFGLGLALGLLLEG